MHLNGYQHKKIIVFICTDYIPISSMKLISSLASNHYVLAFSFYNLICGYTNYLIVSAAPVVKVRLDSEFLTLKHTNKYKTKCFYVQTETNSNYFILQVDCSLHCNTFLIPWSRFIFFQHFYQILMKLNKLWAGCIYENKIQ